MDITLYDNILFYRLRVNSKHSKKYTLHALWFDCNFAPA